MLLRQGLQFLRAYVWRVLLISVFVLLPCFWHKSIEAGDLPSHTYNAWLRVNEAGDRCHSEKSVRYDLFSDWSVRHDQLADWVHYCSLPALP
jgi:hypothetical protein